MGIPKRLIQIYHNWKNTDFSQVRDNYPILPPHWKESSDKWRQLHPTWEYQLWDEVSSRNLIRDKYHWFLDIYDQYPHHIQRVDAAKYFILYEFGGLYVDLDIEPLVPIDKYFNSENEIFLAGSANVSFSLTNALIGSKRKSKFWKAVFDLMVETSCKSYFGKHLTVMNTTGPLMITKVMVDYPGVVGYLPNFFPCNICQLEREKHTSPVKFIKGQSWLSFDSKVMNVIMCNWRKIGFFLFLIILFVIIWFFNHKRIKKKNFFRPY